jgi:hypothetical protein
MFVLIDCPADSGTAEKYTADKCKITVSPPAKGNVCVMVLGDKISYSSVKMLPSGIWRKITWKIVHQAMVGTVSRDR